MFYLGIRENRIKQFKVFFKKTVFFTNAQFFLILRLPNLIGGFLVDQDRGSLSFYLFFIYLLFEQGKDSGCINGT